MPIDEPDPPQVRDYTIKAWRETCQDCHEESPQVYQQAWICLNHECCSFWKINGIDAQVRDLAYNPAFKSERTLWTGPTDLAPLMPPLLSPQGGRSLHVTQQNRQGMVCRNCAKCCARTHWDAWRCDNEAGCNFMYQIPRASLTILDVIDPNQTFNGHAISADKTTDIFSTEEEYYGFFYIRKYDMPGLPGIQFTHFLSNNAINQAPGGPDDLFVALQEEEIGLRRYRMKTSRSEWIDVASGTKAKVPLVAHTLTNHFSKNFVGPQENMCLPMDTCLRGSRACLTNMLCRRTLSLSTTHRSPS